MVTRRSSPREVTISKATTVSWMSPKRWLLDGRLDGVGRSIARGDTDSARGPRTKDAREFTHTHTQLPVNLHAESHAKPANREVFHLDCDPRCEVRREHVVSGVRCGDALGSFTRIHASQIHTLDRQLIAHGDERARDVAHVDQGLAHNRSLFRIHLYDVSERAAIDLVAVLIGSWFGQPGWSVSPSLNLSVSQSASRSANQSISLSVSQKNQAVVRPLPHQHPPSQHP